MTNVIATIESTGVLTKFCTTLDVRCHERRPSDCALERNPHLSYHIALVFQFFHAKKRRVRRTSCANLGESRRCHPTIAQCRRHWVIVASGFAHNRRRTNDNNRAGIPISTCYVLLCLFLVSLTTPSTGSLLGETRRPSGKS